MKLFLVILAFPTLFVFLLTIAMVRSAQQKYERQQMARDHYLRQIGTASALWGSLVLFGGAIMTGMGLGAKSPFIILAVAVLVGGGFFARLSKGVLWGKARAEG